MRLVEEEHILRKTLLQRQFICITIYIYTNLNKIASKKGTSLSADNRVLVMLLLSSLLNSTQLVALNNGQLQSLRRATIVGIGRMFKKYGFFLIQINAPQ